MRRIVFVILLLAALAPATALAVRKSPGDGLLSVNGARGVVTIQARGAVIGRFDRGQVMIVDLTPADANEPIVWGADVERTRARTTVYTGTNVRFRLIGGAYRVTVRGVGIDISAVGRGVVFFDGDERFADMGVYSLTGDDCRFARQSCLPIPDKPTRLQLGASGRDQDRVEERQQNTRGLQP